MRRVFCALLAVAAVYSTPAHADGICYVRDGDAQRMGQHIERQEYAAVEGYFMALRDCYVEEAAKAASVLGAIAARQGNYKAAVEHYGRAIALAPHNDWYRLEFQRMKAHRVQ